MGLLDGIKKLQDMAEQAKSVAGQLKSAIGGQSQPSMPSTYAQTSEVELAQTQLVPDASGHMVIQSEGQMATWLDSVSAQTKSPMLMKVIDAQMQVIKFVKAPSLLGMVLDNMIAVLYQTLREASSEKEKTELRETISLMIQNLIFFSDAQLHYAIDKNKQEAKQLLSTAGDMLAKSVASVASLAAGPAAVAGVVVKNIFASEEMQNGFFGKLIGWIMDRKQIEKHIEDFHTSLRNLFDTFDKYAALIGPSIQINGMLHRYEAQLVTKKSIESYSGLYRQFINDVNSLNDKGLELNAEESLKNLETFLAPLNISLEGNSELGDGVLQMMGKVYLGTKLTNKISKSISGENRNLKDASMNSFNFDFLVQIKEQFDQYVANYSSKIESLKTEIAGLSFIKIAAKKELEKQLQEVSNELKFCNEVISKLNYYISNARKIEDAIGIYADSLSNTTEKYSLNYQSISESHQANNSDNAARQKFDKMWEMALADGEISEKEKDILWKYAEAAGIDEGEFELMIENKINLN